MDNLQNKKIEQYKRDGDLDVFQKTLDDYWDNSRRAETESINELEKHIWLLNSGSATLLIGYLQTIPSVTCWQLYAAASFVAGVVLFFILKYIGAYITSRDRARFKEAHSKFIANEETDFVFKTVRDKYFGYINKAYVLIQFLSGILFVLGLILLLKGIWYKAITNHCS